MSFDTTCSQYTTTNVVKSYIFNQGCHTLTDKKCKNFLNMLINKFKNPIYQSYYMRVFNISKPNWKNIYINKIKNIHDKNISAFHYKLLNNILSCKSFLHQCKLKSNNFCDYKASNFWMWQCQRNVVKTGYDYVKERFCGHI